ncbi:uncharacterized protein METZ01_LOCUS174688, partial [marine metagenome]
VLSRSGRHDASDYIPCRIPSVYLYYSRLNPAVTTPDPRSIAISRIHPKMIHNGSGISPGLPVIRLAFPITTWNCPNKLH